MELRNIKIKFKTKAPAGYDSNEVDFCSAWELAQWEESGEYVIEVIDNPNTKKSKKKK